MDPDERPRDRLPRHGAVAGVDAPRPGGRDERGRLVLEHVEGTIAMDGPDLGLDGLARVGALVRRIHDASECLPFGTPQEWEPLIPAPDAPDLLCHNDLTPWNLVVGDRWVFIDWDGAGPSTRLWDLAYSAQAFCLPGPHQDVETGARRLAAFADGYRADDVLRAALPTALVQRTWAMHDMLRDAHADGREPWGTMYASGHGAHWRAAAEHVERHRARWGRALLDGA